MGQHIVAGNPPVAVHLRRSAQAKRISLRISGLDARVTLTLPRGVSESEGLAFVDEKADWIRAQVAARPGLQQVGIGAELPFLGQPHLIKAGQGRQVQVLPGQFLVPGPEARVAARLLGFLKSAARDRLVEASDHYARRLGKDYSRIKLRDTRSRWGSCSSEGGLMYSWRLIFAPEDVLRYVAAHEVAHLKHMNHSDAFWDQVYTLYGDYSRPRRWLREQGNALHQYRFTD